MGDDKSECEQGLGTLQAIYGDYMVLESNGLVRE
jgi:hypothetical protein